MLWSDAHCHLCCMEDQEQASRHLAEARSAGCALLLDVATDHASWVAGTGLADLWSGYHLIGAVTPHNAVTPPPGLWEQIEAAAQAGRLCAIGETGLDSHAWESSRAAQEHWLRLHLALASSCHLPVVVHCRDRFQELFSICQSEAPMGGRWAPGMLHCFTGTLAQAERLIEQGWLISFSGIVTFKKSEALREVARSIPLEALVIESDAPWLAPMPHRGRENRPLWCQETLAVVAACRGIYIEELALATVQNLSRYFRLKVGADTERVKEDGVPSSAPCGL